MIFSLLRRLAGFEKPSQDNAEPHDLDLANSDHERNDFSRHYDKLDIMDKKQR
jgi:hypothetical protein